MQILLLSAYDARSHRQWRTTLADLFAEFQWNQLALPPRHFNWRVRGNSLSWGFGEREQLLRRYDLVIATSMVDLASLRGMVPELSKIPTLVYFHENQFAYPDHTAGPDPNPHARLDAQMVSLYAALCADTVVFNSHYNRNSFLLGVEQLLQKLPDFVPTEIMPLLTQSEVLPVPLPVALFEQQAMKPDRPTVLRLVWNHRWEFDKGPELLHEVISTVLRRQLAVEFYILGQQFRVRPDAFARIEKLLASQVSRPAGIKDFLGYIENPAAYYATLASCDVVLSTALHDFQGLAILEACALGCTPLLPDDLVYPEYFPQQFLFQRDELTANAQTAELIADRLAAWIEDKRRGTALPKFASGNFNPHLLKKDYLALFERTQEKHRVS